MALCSCFLILDCSAYSSCICYFSVAERLPVLNQLSNRYRNAVVSSAESERSNSIYKLINSVRRRRLTESNLKMMVFLYYNKSKEVNVDSEDSDDE